MDPHGRSRSAGIPHVIGRVSTVYTIQCLAVIERRVSSTKHEQITDQLQVVHSNYKSASREVRKERARRKSGFVFFEDILKKMYFVLLYNSVLCF